MNETEDDESDSPTLVLAGRVPVEIVNEGAPAEVKPGAVIGIALEPFDDGRGVIEMLVMTR